MKQDVYGVVPPIPTPVDENERVDEAALRAVIERCIEGGLHGIFVCGTNGETMALRQEEREKAIRITLDAVGDRVPVIAGCMDSGTERVIDNIKAFEQMGGKTAVVTAEFYSRHSSKAETIRHFERIASSVEADIFVYNIPPFTGTSITPDMIFEIATFDHVVGFKDTGADFTAFQKVLRHFAGTDFRVLQGMTGQAAASMLLGADGFVPGIGPIIPSICVKIYEYGKQGDIEKTKAYDALLAEAQESFGHAVYGIAAGKAVLSEFVPMRGDILLPSEPVTEEQKKKMTEIIRSVMEKEKALPF